MNTTHDTRSTTTRGTIIKVPDATAGIVFVSGQQRPFTIPGIWRSSVAPAPNMSVEVELDSAGSVAALTAVARRGLGGLVERMLGARRLPALLVICGFAWHSTFAQTPQVETQTIAGVQPNQAEVSPHGAHVAAAVLRGSRSVMTWDGVDGPRFDEIVSIPPNTFVVDSKPAQVTSLMSQPQRVVFSPDGEHFIYAARAGQEFVVMADGKEVGRGPWATDALAGWGFSPSGKHFYYVAHKKGGPRETYELMYDGKPEPASNELFLILFSPDGEHHAYVQRTNPPSGRPTSALLVDGKPAGYPPAGQQILWDDNTAPVFTADGLHLLVQAASTTPGVSDVFGDGKPLMRANAVKLFAMPAGSGFVGVVTQTNGPNGDPLNFATAGSRKIPGSDCPGYVGINGVFLSADGKHAAIRCQVAPTQQWVMVDGKKGLEYQNITDAVFTADGRAVYVASSNGKFFVVIGDAESDGYSMILPPASTQLGTGGLPAVLVAGNHVGWMAGPVPGSNDQAVVVDGKAVIRRNAGNLELSPDGSRFALTFGPGQLSSANIDGVDEKGATVHPYFRPPSSKPQPPQGFFKFSPDSKHVVHFGRAPGTNTYGLFIDGKFLAVPGVNARCLSFTPDSRHLIWLDQAQGTMSVFVDGVIVGQLDQTGVPAPDSWDVSAEGTVTYVFTNATGDVKRIRIHPSAATSIDTMLARAK